jgi:UDP-N-acetylmuramyl pentapeptide phosphotransferase/UDP-N-acetylglucosamine-1-phosphate transferase
MIPKTIIAIILIALGIAAFAYQGITSTNREKVVDLGPIQVTSETTKTFPLAPIVGGVALLTGIVLLVMYCWSCEAKKSAQEQDIATSRNLL